MKVKELKEYLSKFPDDLRVMEYGYEGGYKDILEGEVKKIALEVNSEWYYGPHEDADNESILKDMAGKTIVDALII
jgi:hypothetical protein